MRTIVKGKNVEVPDRVRDYTERKLHRLDRLLDDRTDAIVEFSNETHRSASDAHIAEVTLVIDGRTLRSHAVGISYQAALDEVVDKVERQAVDHKSKPRAARPAGAGEATPAARRRDRGTWARPPDRQDQALRHRADVRGGRRRDDGRARSRFFVFVNAETERIADPVRPRRWRLGLIEPVIGGEYTKGRAKAASPLDRAGADGQSVRADTRRPRA